MEFQKPIKVLLLSDIHMALDNVQLLKQWHSARNKNLKYDYVFISGDIHTLANDGTTSPTENSMAEGQIKALFMNELEAFADELIYIPGNHDPITMFNKDRNNLPILSSNVEGNIHRGIL